MTNEVGSALSNVILSVGTIILGLKLGDRKSGLAWKAFFIALGCAAAFGALYHGTEQFHTRDFWVLVSCADVATGFLFLAACLLLAKPNGALLRWLWLGLGLLGVLVGGLIAPFPFFYVSIVVGFCVAISALVLQKAPPSQARRWIYVGMTATLVGFVAREVTHFSGLFSPDALFHLIQLVGNFLFWKGARLT